MVLCTVGADEVPLLLGTAESGCCCFFIIFIVFEWYIDNFKLPRFDDKAKICFLFVSLIATMHFEVGQSMVCE